MTSSSSLSIHKRARQVEYDLDRFLYGPDSRADSTRGALVPPFFVDQAAEIEIKRAKSMIDSEQDGCMDAMDFNVLFDEFFSFEYYYKQYKDESGKQWVYVYSLSKQLFKALRKIADKKNVEESISSNKIIHARLELEFQPALQKATCRLCDRPMKPDQHCARLPIESKKNEGVDEKVMCPSHTYCVICAAFLRTITRGTASCLGGRHCRAAYTRRKRRQQQKDEDDSAAAT